MSLEKLVTGISTCANVAFSGGLGVEAVKRLSTFSFSNNRWLKQFTIFWCTIQSVPGVCSESVQNVSCSELH